MGRDINFRRVDSLSLKTKKLIPETKKQSFSAREIISQKSLVTNSDSNYQPKDNIYFKKTKPYLAFLFTYFVIMALVVSFLKPELILGKRNNPEAEVKGDLVKQVEKPKTDEKENVGKTVKKATDKKTLPKVAEKEKGIENSNVKKNQSVDKNIASNVTGWERKESGTTADLWAVSYGDENTAWAVGDGGVICKTTDGGETWTVQTYTIPGGGTVDSFKDVSAVDANNVWIVGSVHGTDPDSLSIVLKSTNGGTSWTQYLGHNIFNPNPERGLVAISAVDANNVWLVGGSGAIVKTVNSGTSWSIQTLPGGATTNLEDIDAISSTVAWTGGEGGAIYKTVNGGTNWTAQTSGVATSIEKISAVDENIVWARYISSEKILKTVNGGTNWTLVDIAQFLQYAPTSICAINENIVWGIDGTYIVYTTNGFSTAYNSEQTDLVYTQAIDAFDENSAIAVGNDGGIILATPPSPSPSPSPTPIGPSNNNGSGKHLVSTGTPILIVFGLLMLLISGFFCLMKKNI